MMLHSNTINSAMGDPGRTRHSKRKATVETPEGNERLSKRLSLLNLGKHQTHPTRRSVGRANQTDNAGAKAYLAVGGSQEPQSAQSIPTTCIATPTTASPALPVLHEQPQHNAPFAAPVDPIITDTPEANELPRPLAENPRERKTKPTVPSSDNGMSIDDTKYKVYIHNIDAELADDEAESSSDSETTYEAVRANDTSGKLVFLPVMKRHLRTAARDAVLSASFAQPAGQPHQKLAIPRPILPNKDGELAGMQVVLYREPTSLSVAPENDSVRQAILDTRARYRERRREEEERERRQKGELELVDVTDINNDNCNDNDDTSMTSTPVPGTPIASAVDTGNESDVMDLD
ncbi:hypothetical protein F503_05168 [Ophiostoma piceae UAMH 11346]|uniref:Uncharacterized protein n=1 Tax=Ophiostoma piceae (strain UAMH 11346) TaxID=1262450 RepID=S3CTP5_OPHP1|nr:hypothetical protein F503_05168 [Ophiostoma piceae UAMH 11346]